jgi:uncharacterized protein (DUF2384 family)
MTVPALPGRALRAVGSIALDEAAASAYDVRAAATRVIDVLGNNVAADLLGVSRAQTSRWKNGRSAVGHESAARVLNLDYVLGRLLIELFPDQVGPWLTTPNSHLNRARPIDVLALKGPAEVIRAVEAEASGAYA